MADKKRDDRLDMNAPGITGALCKRLGTGCGRHALWCWFWQADSFVFLISRIQSFFDQFRNNSYGLKFVAIVRGEAIKNADISAILQDKLWLKVIDEIAQLAIDGGELDPQYQEEFVYSVVAVSLGIAHQANELSSEQFARCLSGMEKLYMGSLLQFQNT